MLRVMIFVMAGLSAVPATAATLQAVFTGTAIGGTDTTGLFGAAGADLTGQGVSLTLTYDTSLGRRTQVTGSDTLDGGFGTQPPSTNPILSAVLTVGGLAQSFFTAPGVGFGSLFENGGAPGPDQFSASGSEVAFLANGDVMSNNFTIGLDLLDGLLANDLDQPLSIQPSDILGSFGQFAFSTTDALGALVVNTFGTFQTTGFSIGTLAPPPPPPGPAPVPLPAGAGLLAAALAGLWRLRAGRS